MRQAPHAQPGWGRHGRFGRLAGLLAGGGFAAALLWSGGVLAHCDPADGHFECGQIPEDDIFADRAPGAGDKLVGNVPSRKTAAGAGKIKIKAELVNQRYSNGARQYYLLVDVAVPLPATALGLSDKAQAQDARPVLRYYHADQSTPYAECFLEPRSVKAASAVYSLGMKANAAHTLLRWGHCDDAKSAGFDSIFPKAISGDKAVLVGADGKPLAEFEAPIVVDVPLPDKLKKLAQPATAKLLEASAAYKIKK
ncbi:hypothetical protein [Methylomagnum sp.]